MGDLNWLAKLHIRTVIESDLPGLEWEGQYAHFRRIYADAYERATHGRSVLWVADLLGRGIIGQAFVQLVCDRPELADGHTRAYFYAFRVRPEYRSLGVGSRMMTIIEDDLRKRGFQWITLNVARDNQRARKLYEGRGYHVIAPEPGRWSYPDQNGVWHSVEEPAWRMEKRL